VGASYHGRFGAVPDLLHARTADGAERLK